MIPRRLVWLSSLALCCLIPLAAVSCKEKVAASEEAPGCVKDTDCKGDRVCVKGNCEAAPQAPPATPARPTASATSSAPASAAPALPKITISTPPNKQGISQRAIVKDKPGPSGQEIARLDNGTPVGLIKKGEGGLWVNIRWPFPDGTQEGWVHVNLIRE